MFSICLAPGIAASLEWLKDLRHSQVPKCFSVLGLGPVWSSAAVFLYHLTTHCMYALCPIWKSIWKTMYVWCRLVVFEACFPFYLMDLNSVGDIARKILQAVCRLSLPIPSGSFTTVYSFQYMYWSKESNWACCTTGSLWSRCDVWLVRRYFVPYFFLVKGYNSGCI